MVILMLTNAMVNLNTAITLSSIESAQERLVDQNSKAGLTARAAISLLAGVCWEERVSSKRNLLLCSQDEWVEARIWGEGGAVGKEEKSLCPMTQFRFGSPYTRTL